MASTPPLWLFRSLIINTFGSTGPEVNLGYEAFLNFDRFLTDPKLRFVFAGNARDGDGLVRVRVGGAWAAVDGTMVGELTGIHGSGGNGVPITLVGTVPNVWSGFQLVKVCGNTLNGTSPLNVLLASLYVVGTT